ncbi:hypothetical protein, partial [Thioalkalivibrio sp.]|uniref:hypothetical protein n=1 Tax=Thioalkalivibrio sp. TaxID=2093813 RepID=UPI003975971E
MRTTHGPDPEKGREDPFQRAAGGASLSRCKYIDRTKFHKISEIDPGMPYIQLRGKIKTFQAEGAGRNKRLTAVF